MRESVFYQDLVQEVEQQNREKWLLEGERHGIEKGRLSMLQQIVQILRGWNFPVERLLKIVGISMAELEPEVQQEDE